MRALTVLDYLDATASRLPDKVFLTDEEESLTYARFRERAMTFGYALHRALESGRHRPVVLFMEKSCRCAIAMTGVIYSGNFYVMMDVNTPLERLEHIMQAMGNAVIVTSEKDERNLKKIGYTGTALMYEDLLAARLESDGERTLQALRQNTLDTDLMYVIFTSGSTGIPKGVAAMHRSVIDYVESTLELIGISEDDIVGNQGPFYTDRPLIDIFMTMKAGASVCVIPQRFFMMPKKLLQCIDENHITNLMWVPTAFRIVYQFDALSKVRPAAIRKMLFVGEVIPIPVYRYWREYYPDAEYRQLYGPSEITGVCTYYRITKDYEDGETIPIGKPLPNTGILLLDENEHVVEPENAGVPGEICVYGTCLAAGYYNDPKKTAEVFVQNPTITAYPSLMYRTGDLARYDEEGELVFISRKDYQVKHGGRRIELGEVETAFQAVEGVKAVCCVQDRREDKLVLYYIGAAAEDDMPLLARDRLPKYMIPAVYHKMDELPTLPNGKLNRKLLDQRANE